MGMARIWECVLIVMCSAGLVSAQGIEVNGDFEALTGVGWTEWAAPWSGAISYDYGWAEEPFEGDSSLYMQASSGSFGVYQEFCVEAGVPFEVSWAWRGRSAGNGWWEVLIVDAPYSYEAVDDPINHPETTLASKWEVGFGGAYPEPSEEWTVESAQITPLSDTVTVVLKCGSTEGGLVEAWFDDVIVTHQSSLLEVTAVEPPRGRVAGGDPVRVFGRNLPADAVISLGTEVLEQQVLLGTCEIAGVTPAGEAGAVDVTVTTSRGTATLPDGFRYVPPPTISSINPDSGPVEGGTEVTLLGEHFETIAGVEIEVMFGEVPLGGVEIVDETTLTGTTPPNDEGAVDVRVRTPFGEIVVTGGFTYVREGPIFRRGDCDADGSVNITDAIVTLGFLFLGAAEPSCLEACNGDGDPTLVISDAIVVLSFLFTGGAAPPPPHPGCGVDLTPSLSCNTAHPDC